MHQVALHVCLKITQLSHLNLDAIKTNFYNLVQMTMALPITPKFYQK